MLALIADENFNRRILQGMFRVLPELDVVRTQDIGLTGISDPELLAWCAKEERVLLTHDARTLVGFAFDRVRAQLQMPGVIEVSQTARLKLVIEELTLWAYCAEPEEVRDQVIYVP